MANIRPMEIIVVLIIALVVLGPRRLPGMGKSLGRGIREFRGSIGGHDDDTIHFPHTQATADPAPAPAPRAIERPREREIV